MEYTIKFALYEDIPRILAFLRSNAFSNNNLVTYLEHFKFYFVLCDGKHINFAIAEGDDGRLYGACGYVKSAMQNGFDVWTALWNVVENPYGIRGGEIKKFIVENSGARFAACNNITKETIQNYKRLGYTAGKMNHYYRAAEKSSYIFLDIVHKQIEHVEKTDYKLEQILSFADLKNKLRIEREHKPFKDWWYVERRYIKYPWHKYSFYGVENPNGQVSAVLVVREIEHLGVSMLRISDCLGNYADLAYVGFELQRLMDENDYEYIEFHCFGIDHDIMKRAGFTLTDENDNNFISTHLEPFRKIRRDYYYYSTEHDNFTIFKADGDHDRNFLI